jgi:hypothetical protein
MMPVQRFRSVEELPLEEVVSFPDAFAGDEAIQVNNA